MLVAADWAEFIYGHFEPLKIPNLLKHALKNRQSKSKIASLVQIPDHTPLRVHRCTVLSVSLSLYLP